MTRAVRAVPVPIADTRPLRQAVLRPREPVEAIIAHEAPNAWAIGGFDDDGRLVSVGFIAPTGEPGEWRVRGMATSPEARGRGAGSAVLEALVAHARAQGATLVWCNARVRAHTLYERAGFRVVSDVFEIPGIGPHYRMELANPQ